MRWRRSPTEIAFRLHQEQSNLRLAMFPPAAPDAAQAKVWPDPAAALDALAGSPLAADIIATAESVLRHKFPLLGLTLDTGPELNWRRDYLYGKDTPIRYFRRIPYLDFEASGDHKIIWELNRHQHLVLLAQAYRLSGRTEFLDEIASQLKSWWPQNPFQRSIQWCSALEVAFRAWSWLWVDHFVGRELPPDVRTQLVQSLLQHGAHLSVNLSVYFSPNTHLLGEAMVLHALATLYPSWPQADQWRSVGRSWVRSELSRQMQSDGSHFEQSSYYHVYALDMFVAHYLLDGRPPDVLPVLRKAAEFLDAMTGTGRSIPLMGDDDGGRLFHPYGSRPEFGCATLATCSILLDQPQWVRRPEDLQQQAWWWLGPVSAPSPHPAQERGSRVFAASGLTILQSGGTQVFVDCGPLGAGAAGHSHADSLQVLVRTATEELLIDPGTFTYIADEAARNEFRGTAAHNTLRIGKKDQATPAGPFRWNDKPTVSQDRFETSAAVDFVEATCRYRGYRHRRRVLWQKPGLLVIFDDVQDGGAESCELEQFWHPGVSVRAEAPYFRLGETAMLWLSHPAEETAHWRSLAFGQRSAAPALRVYASTALPWTAAAVLFFEPPSEVPRLLDPFTLRCGGSTRRFPAGGGWEPA